MVGRQDHADLPLPADAASGEPGSAPGGLIGEIRIVTMGGSAMVRDITVYADDARYLDRLLRLTAPASSAIN